MKWVSKGKKKKYSIKRLFKGIGYSISGIIAALKTEQNLLIELIMGIIVTILGIVLKISMTELCIILLCVGIIVSLELVNTSIENIVDMTMPQVHPLAKLSKDIAEGAVLFFSIISLIVVLLIFIPKL